MLTRTWPCPLPGGGVSDEYLLLCDGGGGPSVLMIPPLFDEHNKLRAQIVSVMRCLGRKGIGSALPDLPGCNESLLPLDEQSLSGWREAILAAVSLLEPTHVLAWRSGSLLAPADLPGWQYAPQTGAKQLRGMLRARTIAAKEAGKAETLAELEQLGRTEGIELAGWPLNADMFRELEAAQPHLGKAQQEIAQGDIGGPALWLRAEPERDEHQAEALATILADQIA